MRDAQTESVDEATADLAAAKERHRVGVAALSDELQAQTSLSQAQLQLETLDSNLQAALVRPDPAGPGSMVAFRGPETPSSGAVGQCQS